MCAARRALATTFPVMSPRRNFARLCPRESREDGSSASISRDRASPFSVYFFGLSIDEEGFSPGDDKPRDPYNAARPRANWIFFKGVYPRVLFTGSGCHEWRFRRGGLAQWAWRRKPRSIIGNPQKMTQEVGAGGNAARDGGCDACAGHSARSVVVRHLKVPI